MSLVAIVASPSWCLSRWLTCRGAALVVGQQAGHRPALQPVYASHGPATVTVGQHTVRAGESIPVPTWTPLQVGESIPTQ